MSRGSEELSPVALAENLKAQHPDVFATPGELIELLKKGEMIILVDDENRENEGDLILAAQHVTPEKINFMIKHARGLICLALSPEQADRLQLRPMVDMPQNSFQTHFLVSIEAASGVTTGISAADRARTIYVASRPDATPADIRTPGHVFPIKAKPGGVLQRAGHTEASVDYARLAGLWPAAVICEIMKDDGTMARLPDLIWFARQHGLKIGTIDDLIRYRMWQENFVQEKPIPHADLWQASLKHPHWQLRWFTNRVTPQKALVVLKEPLLPECAVRMQRWHVSQWMRQNLSGEPVSWWRQLKWLDEQPMGFVFVLFWPSSEDELWAEPVTTDVKDIGFGSQILRYLGVRSFHLVTRNTAWMNHQALIKAFDLNLKGLLIPPEGI